MEKSFKNVFNRAKFWAMVAICLSIPLLCNSIVLAICAYYCGATDDTCCTVIDPSIQPCREGGFCIGAGDIDVHFNQDLYEKGKADPTVSISYPLVSCPEDPLAVLAVPYDSVKFELICHPPADTGTYGHYNQTGVGGEMEIKQSVWMESMGGLSNPWVWMIGSSMDFKQTCIDCPDAAWRVTAYRKKFPAGACNMPADSSAGISGDAVKGGAIIPACLPSPTPSPSPSPTTSPSPEASPSPTVSPSPWPTQTASPTPTTQPTVPTTPTPHTTPTKTPTTTPTVTPTMTPTQTPTSTPTNTPTSTPTQTPSETPTQSPSSTPTDTPSTPPKTPTGTATGGAANTTPPMKAAPAPSDVVASAKDFAALQGLEAVGSSLLLSAGDTEPGEQLSDEIHVVIEFSIVTDALSALFQIERDKIRSLLDLLQLNDTWVIKLPQIDPSKGTPVLFRQVFSNWVMVPEQRYEDQKIRVPIRYCGYYQVFIPIADMPFSFNEVYVYPNPARPGDTAILHVEIGQADSLKVRIYDLAGDLVYESRITEAPIAVNGKSAYEHKLDASRFKSGAYIGVVTAERSGKETTRKKFRLTFLR